jgi:hypothetical protein
MEEGFGQKTDEGYIILARATYKQSKTWAALTLEQKAMMVMLIMMANHKDNEWWDAHLRQFVTIKRGQMVTSLASLKKSFGKGSSIRKIRTCLTNLENMGFLTNQSTNHYRLITLAKYDFYQLQENYATRQSTKQRQSSDKAATTNKQVKHVKHLSNKDTLVDFVGWFNAEFKTNYRMQTYADSLTTRLKTYTVDQMKSASLAMKRDPMMMGSNDRNRNYATLEYITRNDKNVDKWLNISNAAAQLKQQPSHDIVIDPDELKILEEREQHGRQKVSSPGQSGS